MWRPPAKASLWHVPTGTSDPKTPPPGHATHSAATESLSCCCRCSLGLNSLNVCQVRVPVFHAALSRAIGRLMQIGYHSHALACTV
eukprot:2829255-Alexandrium_andersonii.AAC.1